MRNILILLLITSITFGQNINPNFLDGTIMFKFENFVEAKDTSNKILDGIGIKEKIEDYPILSDIFRNNSITSFERPSYFSSVDELKKIYRIKIIEENDVDVLIEKLNALDYIEFAEREPLYRIDFQPNDYYYNGSGSNNLNWYHDLINSEGAWDISLGSPNIKIAIVDNAIDASHFDLNVSKEFDVADIDTDASPPLNFQQSSVWSHGTHVAGLAAALTNNEIGIASLGGNAEIIAVKATLDNSDGNIVQQTYNGVIWACENGANVVNMSLVVTISQILFKVYSMDTKMLFSSLQQETIIPLKECTLQPMIMLLLLDLWMLMEQNLVFQITMILTILIHGLIFLHLEVFHSMVW